MKPLALLNVSVPAVKPLPLPPLFLLQGDCKAPSLPLLSLLFFQVFFKVPLPTFVSVSRKHHPFPQFVCKWSPQRSPMSLLLVFGITFLNQVLERSYCHSSPNWSNVLFYTQAFCSLMEPALSPWTWRKRKTMTNLVPWKQTADKKTRRRGRETFSSDFIL